jgi:hypothetical protein
VLIVERPLHSTWMFPQKKGSAGWQSTSPA